VSDKWDKNPKTYEYINPTTGEKREVDISSSQIHGGGVTRETLEDLGIIKEKQPYHSGVFGRLKNLYFTEPIDIDSMF